MILSVSAKFTGGGKGSSRSLGGMTSLMFAVVGAAMVSVAGAQSPSGSPHSAKPEFEVASVRLCNRDTVRGTNLGTFSAGRVSFTCQNLISYIQSAYAASVQSAYAISVSGGPAWIEKDLYQIAAKTDSGANLATTEGPMMQALLEDRFKLKVHKEGKEAPAYALVVAKAGRRPPVAETPCFTRSTEHPFPVPAPGKSPPPICGAGVRRSVDGINIHGSTLAEFCLALSKTPLKLDRHKFIDQTGIEGRFDLDLKFPYPERSREQGDPGARPDLADDFTNLQDALMRVGLKLMPTRASTDVVVIDHVERPAPN